MSPAGRYAVPSGGVTLYRISEWSEKCASSSVRELIVEVQPATSSRFDGYRKSLAASGELVDVPAPLRRGWASPYALNLFRGVACQVSRRLNADWIVAA